MDAGVDGGPDHVAVGDGLVPESQVVADRPAEEERLVVDHRDLVGEDVAGDLVDAR